MTKVHKVSLRQQADLDAEVERLRTLIRQTEQAHHDGQISLPAAVNLITRLTNAITRLIATDYRVNPKLDEREQRMRNDLERVLIELGYGPEE